MSFSCGCDSDGYVEFYSVSERRARKEHKCCECRSPILAGDLYEYRSYKFYGSIYSNKTCERCVDLRTSYEAMGFCLSPGELWEGHLEELRNNGADKTSRAMTLAREVLASRRKV